MAARELDIVDCVNYCVRRMRQPSRRACAGPARGDCPSSALIGLEQAHRGAAQGAPDLDQWEVSILRNISASRVSAVTGHDTDSCGLGTPSLARLAIVRVLAPMERRIVIDGLNVARDKTHGLST